MQKNIQRIAVTGVHKLDIAMYVAYVLQCLGYRILICDRTHARETAGCIQKPDKAMELVRYREMDFAYSELVALDENYDYILYMQDFGSSLGMQAKRNILVCDGIREHVTALQQEVKQLFQEEQASAVILFRDVYASYAADRFDECQRKWKLWLNVFECPHDCMDEAAYQRLQFQRFIHIAEISGTMETAIRQVLCYGTDIEEKEVRRGIKLAKRGRNG